MSTKKSSEFDYTAIKTFEDACEKLGLDPVKLPVVSCIPEEFAKPIIAAYKLMIIHKAINNGWKPDWNNIKQYKYSPWLKVSSSGFGCSDANYNYGNADTNVGSRLCTDASEKALFIARQFTGLYQDYFLYSE